MELDLKERVSKQTHFLSSAAFRLVPAVRGWTPFPAEKHFKTFHVYHFML